MYNLLRVTDYSHVFSYSRFLFKLVGSFEKYIFDLHSCSFHNRKKKTTDNFWTVEELKTSLAINIFVSGNLTLLSNSNAW